MDYPSSLKLLAAFLLFLGRSGLVSSQDADSNNIDSVGGIQVMFAGIGRSGTKSLHVALTRLGYKAAHGSDIVIDLHGSHQQLAKAAVTRNLDLLLAETTRLGYNATLEIHSNYWRDYLEGPDLADTKFIFVIRDFEPWYQSFIKLYRMTRPLFRYPLRALNPDMYPFSRDLLSQGLVGHVDEDIGDELLLRTYSAKSQAYYKQAHDKLVQDAQMALTKYPDRTILFDFQKQHGYAELCDFLKVTSCPTAEVFPHLNSTKELNQIRMVLLTMEAIFYLAIAGLLWKLLSSSFASKGTNNTNKTPTKKFV